MSFNKDYYLKFGHHNDNIGFILRHHEELKRRGRVLVVPCGYGQIVDWCLANHIDCDGFDTSEYVLSIAKKHLRNQIFMQDIRTMITPLHKYGAVICCDLLEYFDESDIDKSIIAIKNNLSFDGLALIRVCTSECHDFDDDQLRVTKKDMKWWIDKFKSHELELNYGPTDVGEFVVQKSWDDYAYYSPYLLNEFKRSNKGFISICENDKISVQGLRNIALKSDDVELLFFPRSDGCVQVSSNGKMYVSTIEVDEFDIFFTRKMIYLFSTDYDKSVVCKIPITAKYPFTVENNTSILSHHKFDDCSKIEFESNGGFHVSGNFKLHTHDNGDIFLICNEAEEPFCYFAVRDNSRLVFGGHFAPDEWVSKSLAIVGDDGFEFDFEITGSISNSYHVKLNSRDFSLDRQSYGISGDDVEATDGVKCCIIYGRDQNKPLNITTDKFSIEFTQVG